MKHKGCGGRIMERRDLEPYSYCPDETETGRIAYQYPQVCEKCGQEIFGDAQIDFPEELRELSGDGLDGD